MSNLVLSSSILVLGFTIACGTGGAPPLAPTEPPLPIVIGGLSTPESVVHDPIGDVYLVSNIEGSPFEADGRGFVSRIAPDGRVLSARFIDGLDAPKGLALSSNGAVLAVADLTVLKLFDRATGTPRGAVRVPGATFLNDVAAGPNGAFYVTDSGMGPGPGGVAPTGSDAIYRVAADGSVTAIARGTTLAMPNGIATLETGLVLASFGDKRLRRLGWDGVTEAEPMELPAGQSDGVVALERGCIVVSSFEAPGIFAGPITGPFTLVSKGILAADIGMDRRRGRLLVPQIAENALRIIAIQPFEAACTP